MIYIRQRKQEKSRGDHLKRRLENVADSLPPPTPTADTSRMRGPGIHIPSSRQGSSADMLDEYQHIRPPTTAQKAAAFVTAYLDVLTWSALWIIGCGVYMGTGYSMPAQLPLNVLTFFGAMRVPPSVRRFIHPIFPCAAFTILGIFILAAMKRESLDEGRSSWTCTDDRTGRISYSHCIYSVLLWSAK